MDVALRLDEQVALLAGTDLWHTAAVPRAGLPALRCSDGPNGVRGTSFAAPPSALFPCGAALGASWDEGLVAELGAALAQEAHAKSVHLLLAPTVNLARSPLGGRNFEAFGEDPHLTARLAVAYISAVQAGGVACCVKHLVANDVEFERMTVSSEPDDRTLHEVLLAPFAAAVHEADVRAVMASYNRLRGTYASEHPWLLHGLLRQAWGFGGLVVSDWFATHSTGPALRAGLDLEMPGPPRYRGERLLAAVRDGEADAADVARSADRVFELLRWCGLPGTEPSTAERAREDPGTSALLRRAAAAGTVLLRNAGGLLPLDPARTRRVALLGPFARGGAAHGGGSAALAAERVVTPADGLAARGVELVVEPGVVAHRTLPALADDVRVEHLDADGTVFRAEELHRSALFTDPGAAALRLTATLTPDADGAWTVGLTATGPGRLWVDGELVVEDPEPEPGGTLLGYGSREARGTVALRAGAPVTIRAEATQRPGLPLAGIAVGALAPQPPDRLERAVAAARDADVAVVVVGTGEQWESEGADREAFGLPGDQDELVRRVAAVQPRTVVVVAAGAAVAMDWADDVPAVLQTWFAGQEGGHALADVLVGDSEPGGRLPVTIPVRLQDGGACPDVPGRDGVVRYSEGVLVGHRWLDAHATLPRFAFGHGLGYTTFALDDVGLDGDAAVDDLALRVTVRNAGPRAGKAVVQAYLEPPDGPVVRAPRALVAFAAAGVEPGVTATLRLPVARRAFEVWDDAAATWLLPAGPYRLHVGWSSRDLPVAVDVPVLSG